MKKKKTNIQNNINETYDVEDKEYSEKENYSYTANNYNGKSSFVNLNIFVVFIFIFVVGFVFLFISSMGMNNNSAKVVDENSIYTKEENVSSENTLYNNILMSKLEFISFENVGKIPSLYKFDTETKANSCKFTELDTRYKGVVNTLEISYDSIPEESLNSLKQSLINRNYTSIGYDLNGEIYVMPTENNQFLFVIISNTSIIYGGGNGNYENVFNW